MRRFLEQITPPISGAVFVESGAGPVLTLDPGLTLQFDAGASLWVGSAADGALYAVGTESLPITMTSAAETPAPGDWEGLVLRGSCLADSTELEQVVIEYAGGNGWGNLWSHSCEASVTSSTLRHSSSYGLYRQFTTMTLVDITYADNALGDLL